MMPPTQLQREIILSHILLDHADVDPAWIPNLALLTPGCVPVDLIQLKRIVACKGISSSTPTCVKYDEAAYSLVPSQLAALDVQKPLQLITESSQNNNNMDNEKEMFQESFRTLAGYDTMKQRLFRAVVLPWRRHLKGGNVVSTKSNNRIFYPPVGVLFQQDHGSHVFRLGLGTSSSNRYPRSICWLIETNRSSHACSSTSSRVFRDEFVQSRSKSRRA
jgi:hypothetical protein